MITLNSAQRARKHLTVRHINGEVSTREMAIILDMTDRNVRRITAKYKERGDASFIHGNTGLKRETEEQRAIREKIADIYLHTMYNKDYMYKGKVTFACFRDILEVDYGIDVSKDYVRKIIKTLGFKSPKRHKGGATSRHLCRPRKVSMGELVQIDGTTYDWFGDGHQYCLHLFVDDATSYPVAAYMTKNECLLGYIEAFRIMAKRFGLPMSLYADRVGIVFNNNAPDDGKEHLTQFGIMMKNFGVEVIPANSPEAKGRVERENQTLQCGRLTTLFQARGIKTMSEANAFFESNGLYDMYRKWFPFDKDDPKNTLRNRKSKFAKNDNGHDKNEDTAVFVKANMTEINSVLVVKYPHKTDRGGVLSHMGYRFLCPTLPDRKVIVCMNEKEGIWATAINSTERHKLFLAESDPDGRMPEVFKDLVHRTLERNAKPRYREVYVDTDDVIFCNPKLHKRGTA